MNCEGLSRLRLQGYTYEPQAPPTRKSTSSSGMDIDSRGAYQVFVISGPVPALNKRAGPALSRFLARSDRAVVSNSRSRDNALTLSRFTPRRVSFNRIACAFYGTKSCGPKRHILANPVACCSEWFRVQAAPLRNAFCSTHGQAGADMPAARQVRQRRIVPVPRAAPGSLDARGQTAQKRCGRALASRQSPILRTY